MSRVDRFYPAPLRNFRLSLFEKVILVNSLVLVGEAFAGLWVTSHNLEAHHYLIDTTFIVLATVLSLLINGMLLRASFRPLFRLLSTIRAVSAGKTDARVPTPLADAEMAELAAAFNRMLDRLETAHREQATLILEAQEEERRRLARELHDESSQNLTVLLIHAEVLSQCLTAFPPPAISQEAREQLNEGLQQLTRLTQGTLETIRVLAQQLRPSVLDDLGLYAAFRWLAEDGRQRLHLAVELHLDDAEESLHGCHLPPVYETALFRIAQESLTNVARHAHAQHVMISLSLHQQQICLLVRDDGCGYDPSQHHPGLGIVGMRERAALLRGTLSIASQPGQGTIVQVFLPLPGTPMEGVHDA